MPTHIRHRLATLKILSSNGKMNESWREIVNCKIPPIFLLLFCSFFKTQFNSFQALILQQFFLLIFIANTSAKIYNLYFFNSRVFAGATKIEFTRYFSSVLLFKNELKITKLVVSKFSSV
jgi:hypothetical protein